MSVFSLYAMPTHLRPSMSYKGLSSGVFETPKTFKDRVYLTDIVDTFRTVVFNGSNDADLKLLWRKGYFPWRIRVKLYGGSIVLTGKLFGESSWNSAVLMQFKNLDDVRNSQLKGMLEEFVTALNRPPYESPYWTDETWQNFTKTQKISRVSVEDGWAEYLSVLEEDEEKDEELSVKD